MCLVKSMDLVQAAVDKTLDEAQLRGQLLKELKILKEEYEEVKSSYARIQDEVSGWCSY